jgi:hypothetical protein
MDVVQAVRDGFVRESGWICLQRPPVFRVGPLLMAVQIRQSVHCYVFLPAFRFAQ